MVGWYKDLLYELVSRTWISEFVMFILSASVYLENSASVE